MEGKAAGHREKIEGNGGKMKIHIFVSILLLSSMMAAKPAIKFKNATVDFGEVTSGKVIDILFEFENTGNETLTIKNIIPACGCTTANMAKREYKPGEKGTISSKFNTSGYNGKVVKTITVTSNDPEAPETRLTMKGTVTIKDFAQASIRPEEIDFAAVAVGKTYVRTLNLNNSGNQDLRIIEISCSPEVSLEFSANAVAPKKSTEITLKYRPFDHGSFNNLVKIRTNDYRNPYVFVRLEATAE
jgi:hypothetical protein